MDQETVKEEAAKLCQEIKRISGGGTSVRFGDFIDDETIEQTFEAPMGTLKAAKRAGLLTYEGELLLKGQNDNTIISLISSEAPPAAEAPADEAPAEAAPAEEPAAAAETAVEEQAAPVPEPEAPAAEPAPAADEPVAPAEPEVKEEKPADSNSGGGLFASLAPKKPMPAPEDAAPEESAPAPAAEESSPAVAETPAETAPAEATETSAPTSAPDAAAPEEKGEDATADDGEDKSKEGKGWSKVNTSYIDWRTADPNNLEARRASGEVSSTDAATAVAAAQKEATKTDDGKWNQVDTSYINHRTDDPNRLQARRSNPDVNAAEIAAGAAMLPSAKKDEEGKWMQVNTSYINHRTDDPNRLEARRSRTGTDGIGAAVGAEAIAGAAPSATTKKEGDGKWKVDTSYIGYRTADTNNLNRKMEGQEESKYSNPAETKYPYEELKGSNRPADVDPAMKQSYLSDAEFETVMGMSPDAFTKMPKWKQQNLKKAKELF